MLVPTEHITVTGGNPRSDVETGLEDLIASISQHGVLQPLIVRERDGEPARYDLVAGHRRLAAAWAANCSAVPVHVINGAADALTVAIVENTQRRDLNVVDEAHAYAALKKRVRTNAKVAELVGVSPATVAARLQILALDENGQQLMRSGDVPLGVVPVLAQLAKHSPEVATAAAAVFADETMDEFDRRDLLDRPDQVVEEVSERFSRDPTQPFLGRIARWGPWLPVWVFGAPRDDTEAVHDRFHALDYAAQRDHMTVPDELVDQARAYKCLLESGNSMYLTDQAWAQQAYLELLDAAEAATSGDAPERDSADDVDPDAAARRSADAAERKEAKEAAQRANLQTGAALRKHVVLPWRVERAKLVARLLLDAYEDRWVPAAAVVLYGEEDTKTLKSGATRSVMRYPEPDEAAKRVVADLHDARTEEEVAALLEQLILAAALCDWNAVAQAKRKSWWVANTATMQAIADEADAIGGLPERMRDALRDRYSRWPNTYDEAEVDAAADADAPDDAGEVEG